MSREKTQQTHSLSLFPSFFAGGFECSTPINRNGVRIDELEMTGHDRHVRADYRRLRAWNIRTARDGVRWNLVDREGKLDFCSVLPFVEAAEREGITVIWDLFHYGYPDDLHPFHPDFPERFSRYCRAFARLLVQRGHGECGPYAAGTRFYTPINEISFFAWAAGEAGLFAPFLTGGRAPELKRRLVETALCAIRAIREVDPAARFVNCDPLVYVTAPADMPELEEEARYFNEHFVCEAWDMLCGRIAPELGGRPDCLDIVGANYYGINQWEHTRPENVLSPHDPRRASFSDLLGVLYARYRRPILVAETTSSGGARAPWLLEITTECEKALRRGIDLQGICIYPVVGMGDWHTFDFRPMGLWDRGHEEAGGRRAHWPMAAAVRHLQHRLDERETWGHRAVTSPHGRRVLLSRRSSSRCPARSTGAGTD